MSQILESRARQTGHNVFWYCQIWHIRQGYRWQLLVWMHTAHTLCVLVKGYLAPGDQRTWPRGKAHHSTTLCMDHSHPEPPWKDRVTILNLCYFQIRLWLLIKHTTNSSAVCGHINLLKNPKRIQLKWKWHRDLTLNEVSPGYAECRSSGQ